MKRILIAVFITLFATSIPANGPDQYLCITEASTGFNWENGKWVQVNFVEKKLILKRSGPEDVWLGGDSAWVLKNFESRAATTFCDNDFNNSGYLYCSGSYQFQFNRESLDFGLSSITSGFTIKRPSGMGPDSMLVAYGKCSPF